MEIPETLSEPGDLQTTTGGGVTQVRPAPALQTYVVRTGGSAETHHTQNSPTFDLLTLHFLFQYGGRSQSCYDPALINIKQAPPLGVTSQVIHAAQGQLDFKGTSQVSYKVSSPCVLSLCLGPSHRGNKEKTQGERR